MLESLEARRLLATVVVTTIEDVTAIDGKTSLREAVTQAAANDTVEFHATLSGVITLNDEIGLTKNITIQGRGAGTHTIASGGRIFHVGTGVTAAIKSLTVADASADRGGAIFNNGTLTLTGVTLSDNAAFGFMEFDETTGEPLGHPTPALGGAIFNTGTLTLTQCTLSGNQAAGTTGNNDANSESPMYDPAPGFGGAVYNMGYLSVDQSTFSGNSATGGDADSGFFVRGGGGGEVGAGGAIYNDTDAEVKFSSTQFLGNTATGGHGSGLLSGGDGGKGRGGAIYNLGTLSATGGQLSANAAVGGQGGNGDFAPGDGADGEGGAIYHGAGGTLTLTNATLADNDATGGRGGPTIYGTRVSGVARGGAIYSAGTTTVTGAQLLNNAAAAVINQVSDAAGGAIASTGTLSVINTTLAENTVVAGSVANGGDFSTAGAAWGGAIAALGGSLSVNGSTLSGNSVAGGAGGPASDEGFRFTPGAAGGDAEGGGIFIGAGISASVLRSTVFGNTATSGNGGDGVTGYDSNRSGGDALGGGIATDGSGISLTHVTIAGNAVVAGRGGQTPGAGDIYDLAAGGGVSVRGEGGPFRLVARNSIIATNTAATVADVDALVQSSGYNLIGTREGSTGWIGDDILGTTFAPLNPQLAVLADNGGHTQTMLPNFASPVVDAGKSFGFSSDQRGQPRTVDLPEEGNAAGGDGTDIGAVEIQSSPPAVQTPFNGSPVAIGSGPVTIQFEDFDQGGEGVAYHDIDAANLGGAYRPTGVDIQATTDAGGGYNVAYIRAGEWIEYTIDVEQSGNYTFDFRLAAAFSNGKFHVEADAIDRTGLLTIPNTGGTQNWTTLSRPGVMLTEGVHIMRIYMDAAGDNGSVGNINWMRVTREPMPAWLQPAPDAEYTLIGDTLTVGHSWVTLQGDAASTHPDLAIIVHSALGIAMTQRMGSLEVLDGAEARFSAGRGEVLTLGELTLDDGALLDLDEGNLIVEYSGEDSPMGERNFGSGGVYTGLIGQVALGRNGAPGSPWSSGAGITSNEAAGSNGLTALGIAEASDALGLSGSQTTLWHGQPVDATSVLVMYTYAGDANLDGVINIDDYGQIDSNVGHYYATGWLSGDFNYDGKINIDDYGIIDSNITRQASEPLAAEGSLAPATIPHRASATSAIVARSAIRAMLPSKSDGELLDELH